MMYFAHLLHVQVLIEYNHRVLTSTKQLVGQVTMAQNCDSQIDLSPLRFCHSDCQGDTRPLAIGRLGHKDGYCLLSNLGVLLRGESAPLTSNLVLLQLHLNLIILSDFVLTLPQLPTCVQCILTIFTPPPRPPSSPLPLPQEPTLSYFHVSLSLVKVTCMCLRVHGCGAIYWLMDNLLVGTARKTNGFLSPVAIHGQQLLR